jgi:hypothetical protein
MTKWAEQAAARSGLGLRFAEGFQRIVLEGEQEQGAEAAAVDSQIEDN